MDPKTPKTTKNQARVSDPMPHLTLYYHPLSPFVRKVWITALELSLTSHIQLHKVVVAPVVRPKGWPGWSKNNDLVGSFNPIAKIPTLVVKYHDDKEPEFAVFDSKIICEFLQSLAGKGVGASQDGIMYWKRQALHRAADQMLDSKILITYEERIREPEGMYFKPWVEGMDMKIDRGLDLLQRSVEDGTLRARNGEQEEQEAVGLEEVAVMCCLASMDQARREWREGREGLRVWFEAWKVRESYAASKPDVDWVGKQRDA